MGLEGDGQMCVVGKDLEGGTEAAVGEHSGVDPTGELSEFVDGALQLIRRLGQEVTRFGGALLELKLASRSVSASETRRDWVRGKTVASDARRLTAEKSGLQQRELRDEAGCWIRATAQRWERLVLLLPKETLNARPRATVGKGARLRFPGHERRSFTPPAWSGISRRRPASPCTRAS